MPNYELVSILLSYKFPSLLNNQIPDVTVLVPSLLIRQQRDIQEPDFNYFPPSICDEVV